MRSYAGAGGMVQGAILSAGGGGGGGIAEVAGVKNEVSNFTSSTSLALAFSAAIQTGDLLVVCVSGFGALTVASITDTLSNSWAFVQGNDAGDNAFVIGYAISNGNGTPTVTVTWNQSCAGWFMSVDAFRGVHATPLDVDGGVSNGTSTTPADSITTVAANALIVAAMTHNGSANESITENGAWTLIHDEENGASLQCGSHIYRLAGAAGAYTASWTISSHAWIAGTVSFKPA